MSEKFRGKYRIPSARASWHNYNEGVFFVTICTRNMECYFGEIVKNNDVKTMELTELGCYVKQSLTNMGSLHSGVRLLDSVVMPNHIHILLHLTKSPKPPSQTENAARVRTRYTVPVESMRRISNRKGRLSVLIGSFKGAVTKFAKENKILFDWQPRFYDHIVRSRDEFLRIRKYIDQNVANWESDCFNA